MVTHWCYLNALITFILNETVQFDIIICKVLLLTLGGPIFGCLYSSRLKTQKLYVEKRFLQSATMQLQVTKHIYKVL